MSTAAQRAAQLALVSRLKTIFPEIPEWPTPDDITHDHWLAYMKPSHDVGGELDFPHLYENKEEEQWELMTYVLCESLGWGGIWVSEERRRIGNVDVGRAIYLGMPYYSRWLWSVARVLIEKKYITWADLTARLVEVRDRYKGSLNGRRPEAQPKCSGDPTTVRRNEHIVKAMGVGDPQRFAGQAGPAKFKPGDSVRVRELPAMFYTRTPEYCRGAVGIIAAATYETPAPEDETWDREDAIPEWMYIVRFNQAELWDVYTGPQNDTLQTEIPERWLESTDV